MKLVNNTFSNLQKVVPLSVTTFWAFAYLLFVGSNSLTASARIEAQMKFFDVPKGKAIETLGEAARQANVEFFFSAELVQGVHTRPVKGEYEPLEAFRLMLAETALVVFKHETTGVFAVRLEQNTNLNPEMNTSNNKSPKTSKSFVGKLLVALAWMASGDVTAQDVTEEQDAYELSPFVIDVDEDSGYYATSTLAGTRLRSSLKDVASPISVFTTELMDDIGATNMQDALLYSVNVQNENEYAPDDTEGESIASTTQNRVRGISVGTTTVGYFKTNFRSDSYNTERITIARGPNSILFGLGSPAGVLDSTPIRASFDRNFGDTSLRIDNWGSYRVDLDVNVPILEDRVAARFAGLRQNMKTFRDPEYDDESRYYLTVSAKPFDGTTLRASFESIDNTRVRARYTLMEDRISDWIEMGRPLFDHTTGLWTLDDGATWIEMPELGAGWYQDAGIGYQNRVYVAGGQLGGDEIQGLSWQGMGLSYDRSSLPVKTFSDDSLVPSDINYHGESSISELSGNISTLVWEQKVFENLNFEIAYNHENYDRDQDDGLRGGLTGIEADVNYFLPYEVDTSTVGGVIVGDAVLNPNRGRYMVQSEYLGYTQEVQIETLRAMLSYSIDFSEHGIEWLGHHNFGLLYQKEVTDNFKVKRRMFNSGDYWVGDASQVSPNNISTRYYIDIPGLSTVDSGSAYPGVFEPAPWDNTIGALQQANATQTRNQVEGAMFVAQSYLLQDSLVLTFGYRKDEQNAYSSVFDEINPVTNEYITDNVPLNDEGVTQSGITRTYGAVYHTPLSWLSLLYNRSNTFNPQGEYVDWFGDPLPPGTGLGEDYGIALRLFEGKLQAKLTRYENDSVDNVEFDWYYEQPKWTLVGGLDSSWGQVTRYATRLGNDADVNIVAPSDLIRATRDFSSEGYEVELFYKPIDQLDIRFTLAKSKAVNSRVVPHLQDYVDFRMPVWEKYFGYRWGGQNAGVIADPDPDWINNPNTLGYTVINRDGGLSRVEAFRQSEGAVTSRGRDWRSNLIVNYRFDDRLKGVSVGGAVRWRSPDTIGYYGGQNPLHPDGEPVEDVDRPIEGEAILNFDAWVKYHRSIQVFSKSLDWVVQLNVRNLFDDNDFIPVSAYTDGSYTKYSQKTPRTVILTNTIKF